MHRFSKILSHSSGRRKSLADVSSSSSTSSSRRAAKPKRLERSYAVKNVNYEFTPCDSSSSSLFSQDESLLGGSYGGKTSFRVDGTEGEFEIICKTFGFSGIEDFAISPEEYEEMKLKSPSADVVVSKVFKPINYEKPEIDCDDIEAHDVINRKMEGFEICDVVCREFGGSRDLGCNDRRRGVTELSNRLEDGLRINSVTSNDKRVSSRTSVNRRNGIKGMQPTVLLVNKEYSNWDAAGGFEMDSDTFVSGFQSGFSLDEDKEGTEEVGQKHSEKEMDMALRVANFVPSETSSFTSNDDDDSSSTVTEPMSSSSERYRYVIEDWQKGELLGRGSFGSVYEGIADDGFFFAVKEVSLLDQGNDAKQCIIQLEQEIALLSQFEHENIVRYYGTKKVESHLYIFLELVTKGSLMSLYQKYELRGPIAAAYTRQILLGLKYLHDRNVIHRDIKCANILVHTNGLVKLTDFGLAKAAKLNDVKSCKGTVFWMAPEVIRSQGYGLAADIWSLGCTVLEMLTRRFPYHDLEYMSALYRIGQGERPHIPDSLSRDARSFILECLQVDPYLRPTAAQLLDHPFVKRPLTSSSSMYSPQSFIRQI